MEIVGRSCGVRNDPVGVVKLSHGEVFAFGGEVIGVIGTHLQESLQAGAGVLGALKNKFVKSIFSYKYRLQIVKTANVQ